MARLNVPLVAAMAAILLSAACSGRACAGWFGIGDSGKSADAKKAASTDVYDPNRIASGPKSAASSKTSASGGGGLFGIGKPSATPQPSKKYAASQGSKAKKTDKGESTSWWSSWFKPKDPPPPPKSTSEWMKLKPVRW